MYTTQSKMISRAIWVEKKHVWKINLQKNGVRKSFYSSVPGDKGRKICAQNATSWLSGACPFSVSERTTVDTVFERYLQDKALETTNIYTIRNRYNNHIKPIIGKVPVMLLTKQDLKRVIYTAYRKHNLSQKSLKNIRGDLSGFCNYLDCADIRNDLRTSNIKIPSNAKKGQKQALDDIFGPTGTGKTRSVKEGCGYSNCYAVSDYHHPFDGYRGQKVMLFDEFHSSLPLNSMLQYLDGYPLELPCRYANKQACYTEAYIISNLPLEKQYVSEQHEKPEAWDALLRRINCVRVFDLDGSHKDYTVHEYFHPCTTPTFEQIEIDDCPF